MKKKVTKSEMLRQVMQSARMRYRMIGRYSFVKEQTWSDCLRSAWECTKMRFEIIKKEKPLPVIKVNYYHHAADLTSLYGCGIFNND